tara:strand:- start:336 stop:554 length:219 start_codon:yes stop_codon:yes gene_type:complete
MNILAKYKDGYYYKAKIVKIYSKYTCYIKWEDNTSNDRHKSIKDIIVIPEETYINMGIDNILLSSLLLEGVV